MSKKDNIMGFARDLIKKGFLGNILKTNVHPPVKKFGMTVGEVADKLGVELPEKYANLRNTEGNDVYLSHINCEKDNIVLLPTSYPDVLLTSINRLDEIGALIFFCDKDTYEAIDKTEMTNRKTPRVLMDNAKDRIYNFVKEYRDRYDGTVVAITGSFGKTTTKFYIENLLKGEAQAFYNKANNNSIHSIADNIMKYMEPRFKYFVQEVGAVRPGTIEMGAAYLRPDVSIVTNVRGHHLAAYGSLENVFKDKMQVVDKLGENGTAIVNFDDENIAGYDYKCKVLSFGIETEKPVSFRGKNIRQNGELLEMDVEYFGETTHLTAQISGEYNAYNLLAAFAFGYNEGIKTEKIVKSFRECKIGGVRQNLTKYGSNTFLVDCYNVANETILNSIKVIMGLEPEEGGRRIAIVGGENSLGEERTEKTVELGRALAKTKVDEIVCFGDSSRQEAALDRYGDARTLYNTIRSNGFENVRLILSKDEMEEYLTKEVKKGDVVLFKCITYLDITVPIDKAFGTNFCLTSNRVKKSMSVKTEGGFKGTDIGIMEAVMIMKPDKKARIPRDLKIPDTMFGHEIFGIDKRAFYESKIRTLDLGNTVKVLLPGAFKDCKELQSVRFSDSLLHIMRGAFRGCSSLKEVRLGEKIRQIDVNAFDGCSSLEKIYIPESADVRIEKGAIPEKVQIIRN